MRIIVTGGAGFIGSHLCDKLIGEGNEVICIDNLGSGKRENVAHLEDNDKFTFILHDVIEPLNVDGKIDQIYHLASRASPIDYQEFPVETALSNSIGTNNMMKIALEKGAIVLFSSTSEVYGDPLEHPQVEEYWGNVNPIGLRSCYDESKRFGEALLMAYMREYGAKIKIVRIFNTSGPRMRADDGRVVTNFIVQCLKNDPITIFGDGEQTRSFCYVSDLVEGLYKMMNSDQSGPINLGNPNEMTIKQLAAKIKELTGSTSEIVYKPLPSDDPVRRNPNITKAKELIGWEPVVNLEEGLKKTIEYFKHDLV